MALAACNSTTLKVHPKRRLRRLLNGIEDGTLMAPQRTLCRRCKWRLNGAWEHTLMALEGAGVGAKNSPEPRLNGAEGAA